MRYQAICQDCTWESGTHLFSDDAEHEKKVHEKQHEKRIAVFMASDTHKVIIRSVTP